MALQGASPQLSPFPLQLHELHVRTGATSCAACHAPLVGSINRLLADIVAVVAALGECPCKREQQLACPAGHMGRRQ